MQQKKTARSKRDILDSSKNREVIHTNYVEVDANNKYFYHEAPKSELEDNSENKSQNSKGKKIGYRKNKQVDSKREQNKTQTKKDLSQQNISFNKIQISDQNKAALNNEQEFDPFTNPPKLILVQGPPRSGKTTLIRSLIKHYTNQNLSDPKGPITVKTSKKQRITLLECPNDISSMTDLAKVPDIVLCLIDASTGFEMQTFEFLSVLQSHGFPKCVGIATHFDFYKNNKQARKTKQTLRKRLEAEVSKETKLFFISDIKHSLYSFKDIHNLARFISIINPRELEFKEQHPHIIIDRFELLTGNSGNLSDESLVDVGMFGYARGSALTSGRDMYMTGLGFLKVQDIKEISDPVPMQPDAVGKKTIKQQKTQNDQPVSKKGNLKVEKLKDKNKNKEEKNGESENIKEFEEEENEGNQLSDENPPEDMEEDFEGQLPSHKALRQSQIKSNSQLASQQRSLKKFEKLIYAPQSNIGLMMFDESGDYVTIPDKYVVFTKTANQSEDIQIHEGVKIVRELHQSDFKIDHQLLQSTTYLIDGVRLEIEAEKEKNVLQKVNKELAVVSKLAEKVAVSKSLSQKKHSEESKIKGVNLNDVIYKNFDFDRFEEKSPLSKKLFAGQKLSEEQRVPKEEVFDCCNFYSTTFESLSFYKEHLRSKFVTGGFEGSTDEENEEENDFKRVYQNRNDQAFELENDEHFAEINKNMVKKGKYVKIVVKGIKFSTFQHFGQIPLILSQFPFGENTRGFLLIKIKRHRFYSSLLKTNDPLIFSVGLQKFQSLPYFCRKDIGERMRMIKYTPKYDHCLCVAYANYVPNNTGVVAFQTLKEMPGKFRVSAVGVVIGFSIDYKIQKKLKLIGEPFKIYKNTTFIKGMFNSELEVAKFAGAKIKTVSGIRGQVKKRATEGPAGAFRAVFEDKILMSDIVFMRTWYTLQLERYYNPVIAFDAFKLMRTTWQLRKKYGIRNPEEGRQYLPVERPNKRFAPLSVPSKLQLTLPFRTKEKITSDAQRSDFTKRENKLVRAISSEKEKEARYFIQRLKLIAKEKETNKRKKEEVKRAWRDRWQEGMNKNALAKQKAKKKERYQIASKNHRKSNSRNDE